MYTKRISVPTKDLLCLVNDPSASGVVEYRTIFQSYFHCSQQYVPISLPPATGRLGTVKAGKTQVLHSDRMARRSLYQARKSGNPSPQFLLASTLSTPDPRTALLLGLRSSPQPRCCHYSGKLLRFLGFFAEASLA